MKDEINAGYASLFAEVYKQAVKDDCAEVKKAAREALAKKGYNRFLVKQFLIEKSDNIKDMVCDAVRQEAAEYGYGTRKIKQNNIANLVEKIVVEFEKGEIR